MAIVKRHFFDWREPLVKSAVEALQAVPGERGTDLRDTLTVVPTRNAGRRLREALAEKAAEADGAVIPGPIVTPDILFAPAETVSPPSASRAETIGAWCRLLEQVSPGDYPDVFPSADFPNEPSAVWVLNIAKDMTALQSRLAENALTIEETASKMQTSPEPERWQQLAELEKRYLEILKRFDRQDGNRLKISQARDAQPPAGIGHVKVIGVPDPVPLAVTALEKLAVEIPVDIYIHAPEEMAETFDQWGRPLPEVWEKELIDIPEPENNLLLCQEPEQQARRVAEIIDHQAPPGDDLVIGVPDAEVVPCLEDELTNQGRQVYDPAGMEVGQHPLVKLALKLLVFFDERQFSDFADLLRHSALLEFFQAEEEEFEISQCLLSLDCLQNHHLFVRFSDLLEQLDKRPGKHPELEKVCRFFSARLSEKNPKFSQSLLEVLRRLYRHRRLNVNLPEDRTFKQAAEVVTNSLLEIETDFIRELDLSASVCQEILTAMITQAKVYPERPAGAIDLQGWLELLWDDAPCLILTGMNEHRVPASVTGGRYLPDQACTLLGLSDNRRRFARDAYLLRSMIECRRRKGGIVITLGKHTAQGDPLKPSRLLFRCPDEELPERARRLFADENPQGEPVKRESSWRLHIPPAPLPKKISVTRMKDYLQCPFRFYLRHLLKMERQDDTKIELDALDFGSLCHEALEILGAQELRGETKAEIIADRLRASLDSIMKARFGESRPPSLFFQREAMLRRLRAAAMAQAELNDQGWEVIYTESASEQAASIEIEGLEVSGRIDRVDRHLDGRLRVLDYKTAEEAVFPNRTLWRRPGGAEVRDYALVTVNGKEMAWADLQLPLYILMAQQKWGNSSIEAGYFCLPRDINQTGIQLWDSASAELLSSAWDCAAGIIQDIRDNRFWPPADKVAYDDFEELFPQAAQERVDQESLPFPKDG